MPIGKRIAIFHDDPRIADLVAVYGGQAGLEICEPSSIEALQIELDDPLLVAVAVDLSGPKSGGFDMLERIAQAPSQPRLIVATRLDRKSIESIRRRGQGRGLNFRVFQMDDDEEALRLCLTELDRRGAQFGAEHLRDAITRKLLHVEYQPKVPLESNAGECAVEALCRLNYSQFGEIEPEKFIDIAERAGLIDELTDLVACLALRDLHKWRDNGLPVRLALNISPSLLKSSAWSEQFLRRCHEFKIEPDWVTLEITESSSGATLDVAFDVLTDLRLRGFTLSIDDFGTGFASLATLYKLPFNELKIDKSFTFDLQQNPDARALIESTIGMAQRLGLKVVAEGVESESVFRELRLMGCQQAQGFYISKSISADKVPQFFGDWASLMKCEPIREEHALPKIAIIQALLSDILKESTRRMNPLQAFSDFERSGTMGGDSTFELARNIPSLVLQGQIAGALARCQSAVHRLERDPSRSALAGKIHQLRHVLEQELICRNDLDIETSHGPVRLLPRRSALIGRSSKSKRVDVQIESPWFSPGDKNLRVFADGADWLVEDLGSAQGYSIDGRKLVPGYPFLLPMGETIIDTGEHHDTASPFVISLKRLPANPNAITMRLTARRSRLDDCLDKDEWPEWKEDLHRQWIIFNGRVTIGSSQDCAIVLPETGADSAAEIWFRDGFWIAPIFNVPLSIADTPFTEQVPLPAGVELQLGWAILRTSTSRAKADSLSGSDVVSVFGEDTAPLRLVTG